jgi:hypothetical protein
LCPRTNKKPPASFDTDGSNYLRCLLASEQLTQCGVNTFPLT